MSARVCIIIFSSALTLCAPQAHALQIGLSEDGIDRFFLILETYVLPLMVVSTIVLFCGYLASRIYHRVAQRGERGDVDEPNRSGTLEDETEAFLRELRSTAPIEDPKLRREPSVHAIHLASSRQETHTEADSIPLAPAPANRAPSEKPERDSKSGKQEPSVTGKETRISGAQHTASPALKKGSGGRSLREAFLRPRSKGEAHATRQNSPVKTETLPQATSTDSIGDKNILEASASDEPRTEGAETTGGIVSANSPEPSSQTKVKGALPRNPGLADGQQRRMEPYSRILEATRNEQATDAKLEPTENVPDRGGNLGPRLLATNSEAAKARAREIVDSLDYIAGLLKQSSVMMMERAKQKQGLSLEDVRSLHVSGYDEPENLLEDLRKLGGDTAEEVLAAFESVESLNKVVRRLEQMAQTEPLDEGWNDLIRGRISKTLYSVGQIRRTLEVYRSGNKGRVSAGQISGRSGEGSVPVERKKV